eukprot:CCRYP_017098-RB/>CCRYP_017098-RB protein AED:0.47 eAED:1.00 QI:0/0/0/1/0/0/2/0/104
MKLQELQLMRLLILKQCLLDEMQMKYRDTIDDLSHSTCMQFFDIRIIYSSISPARKTSQIVKITRSKCHGPSFPKEVRIHITLVKTTVITASTSDTDALPPTRP